MSLSKNFTPSTKFSSSKERFCSSAATFPAFYLHNLFEDMKTTESQSFLSSETHSQTLEIWATGGSY